jgi:hypothetical protein
MANTPKFYLIQSRCSTPLTTALWLLSTPAAHTSFWIAINPDGKHAYVTTDSNVTLIDLAATRWWAQLLWVAAPGHSRHARWETLRATLMSRAAHQRCVVVMSASAAIHRQCPEPRCVSVSIQLHFEQHARQRPPDSFEKQANGSFTFAGSVIGVTMQATIKPTHTLRY